MRKRKNECMRKRKKMRLLTKREKRDTILPHAAVLE